MKPCLHCGKLFQGMSDSTLFCSMQCRAEHCGARDRKLADRPCAECGKMFRPRHSGVQFCSRACAVKGNLKLEAAKLAPRECDWCGTTFQPTRARGRFCSPSCSQAAKNLTFRLKNGTAILRPPAFDYVFADIRPRPPQLTPARFDAMLMAA
jgi:hypothetical protein